MLTRRVRIQVISFIVIGLLAVSYIAVRYVGLLKLFGVGVYTVHVDLRASGGIFPNAEVDYRGVPVGRVGSVSLTATGVQANLQVDTSAGRIPDNVQAVVADRSVIGEQYVDLRPRTDSGPFLHDGSVIAVANTGIPASANQLLSSSDALLKTVPTGSLRTVVNELDTAFSGSADNLAKLLRVGNEFIVASNRNFPQTAALIDSSAVVLRTQQRTSSSILSFSKNLQLLSAELKAKDGTLRTFLQQVPPAAQVVTSLVKQIGTPLGVVLSNLSTTSQVFLANVGGLQQLLIKLPQAVDIGSTVIRPDGAHVGLTLNFFDPLPCTQGYLGTQRRGGQDTGAGQPLNTSAGCTSAGSTSDVRGSQHVPSDAGLTGDTQPWLTSYVGAGGSTVDSLAALMGSGR